MNKMKAPLFWDPIYDGAGYPVVIWNREEAEFTIEVVNMWDT